MYIVIYRLQEIGYDGDTSKKVLDPACGSGTFLVLAINKAKEFAKAKRLNKLETAKKIVNRIWGFDLNPLAVIAARTNYLFALGDLVTELQHFEIPVYLADSVLWPQKGGQLTIGPVGDTVSINTSVQTFHVPEIWIKDKGFLLRDAAPLIEEMVRNNYTVDEAITRFKSLGLLFPPHENVVRSFYESVLDLHKSNKNGIWAKFIKNVFSPLAAGKFDFIIGNPPWIRWGYLSDDYRNATFNLWKDYGLFSLKGHAAMLGGGEKDFSMLFTYAAIDNYLIDNGKLGFLITQEIFKSKGAGEGFRSFSFNKLHAKTPHKVDFKVLRAHDLTDIQPFEGAVNKTAAIFVQKGKQTTYPVKYYLWKKKKGLGRIPFDSTLEHAKEQLLKSSLIAQPIGNNVSSWQTFKSKDQDILSFKGQNFYQAYRGAGTDPYGVFWLELMEILSSDIILIRNRIEKGKLKIPEVISKIEPDLIYPSVSGGQIERWKINSFNYLLMVQDPETSEPIPESEMKEDYPNTFDYLLQFKEILLNRKSKTIKNLMKKTEFYAMFGIGNHTVGRYKVIWNRMGTDLKATVVSQVKTDFGFKTIIPTDTTALFSVRNEDEAHYLCGIINSKPVRNYISSFSSKGRGFAAPSVMEHLRINKFDKNNQAHIKVSNLSKILHQTTLSDNTSDLSELESQLDKAVKDLY